MSPFCHILLKSINACGKSFILHQNCNVYQYLLIWWSYTMVYNDHLRWLYWNWPFFWMVLPLCGNCTLLLNNWLKNGDFCFVLSEKELPNLVCGWIFSLKWNQWSQNYIFLPQIIISHKVGGDLLLVWQSSAKGQKAEGIGILNDQNGLEIFELFCLFIGWF